MLVSVLEWCFPAMRPTVGHSAFEAGGMGSEPIPTEFNQSR